MSTCISRHLQRGLVLRPDARAAARGGAGMSYSYRFTYRSSAARSTSDSESPRFSATAFARNHSESSARKLRSVVPRGMSVTTRGAVVGFERRVSRARVVDGDDRLDLRARVGVNQRLDRGQLALREDAKQVAGGAGNSVARVHVPTLTRVYLHVKRFAA